jgi:radical SAM superfamily enzyme YgiQ (UPF0313 family)
MTYVMNAVATRHSVYLIDRMQQRKGFSAYLLNQIKEKKPAVAAFSVNSYTVKQAVLLSEKIKEELPEIKIVFGGPGPTIMPGEILSFSAVDAICIGEGEVSFLEYLNALEEGISLDKIKGIWVKKKDGKIIKNDLRPFETDLDSFPFPNWDYWDIETYMNFGEIAPGTIRVLTSRGCPFDCSFCSNPLWQKSIPGSYYRRRRPEKIIEEIKENFAKYKKRDYVF